MLDKLTNDFCNHYSITRSISRGDFPHTVINQEVFSIFDDDAIICTNPALENLIITNEPGSDISIISYEKFHKLTQISNEEVCDFIIYDSALSKFVCCELTNCLSIYLDVHPRDGKEQEGKRAKAYRQLEITSNKLLAVPLITDFIGKFGTNDALFAYRLSDSLSITNAFVRSINAFNRPPSTLNSNIGNGFYFTQRKYPNTFSF